MRRYTNVEMQRAETVADFVHDPVERCSVGATHIVWCHSKTLCGSVHWGHYDDAQVTELVSRLAFSAHPSLAGGLDILMDSRGVSGFDWSAWELLAGHVRRQLATWNERIHRHAIVVPAGQNGTLLAGMLPMLGPEYRLSFFTSLPEAVAWIDRPELPAILDEIEGIAVAARETAPVLHGVRHYLDQTVANASLRSAARALGQSERTLQRLLKNEGTSFNDELLQARLRAARVLLEESDDPIATIARRVGCSSSSRLIALFRREVGETPAQYRVRRRSR
jgi:AraC-like DNA-binding protein